jgi:hypothetical protein
MLTVAQFLMYWLFLAGWVLLLGVGAVVCDSWEGR